MGKIVNRILRRIGRFIHGFFSIGISLRAVVVLLVLVGGGMYYWTYNSMIKKVGGKEDFDEAMRYIEIKDLLDKKFIDPVDRVSMGQSAAAAMVSGLGDNWSYFMTPDEYRTYQLSKSNEYSDIGMSLVKDENLGGFQVIAIYPSSPAAWAGVTQGMLITAVDGQKLTSFSTDQVRTLIRSKLNSKFQLEINNQYTVEVDCTNFNIDAVVARM